MAKAWQAGRLDGIELEAYTVTAGEMIRHTPPEVIYHVFPPAPVGPRCWRRCGVKIAGPAWLNWIVI